jgi:SNF2 family DNA or RNA helicase
MVLKIVPMPPPSAVPRTESVEIVPGQRTVEIEVPQWNAERRGFPTPFLTGQILGISKSGRAVLFKGHVRNGEDRYPINPSWISTQQMKVDGLEVYVDPARKGEILERLDADYPAEILLREERIRGKDIQFITVKVDKKYEVFMRDLLHKHSGSRWNHAIKAWQYPYNVDAAQDVLNIVRDASYVNPIILELVERVKASKVADDHRNDPDPDDIPITADHTTPWRHQKQAYWFAKSLPGCMIAMDMGVGKSRVAIDLIVNEECQTILVICPKSVLNVWPDQVEKWASDRDILVTVLNEGTAVEKRQDAETALMYARYKKVPCMLVITYESSFRDPFASWSLKQKWDCVILDESHRIKSPKGVSATYCGKLGKAAKRRVCLTGTPMPHTPLDIWSQYRFLDPTVFGPSFTAFKNTYAVINKMYQWEEITGWKDKDRLTELVYSIAFRVKKEDVLDLPPFQDIDRSCDLEPQAQKIYNAMEAMFYAGVEDGSITAANALVRLLRLQQITGGSVNNDLGQSVQVSTSKETLLADVLEDLEIKEPVVVFCRFRHDMAVVRRVAEKQGRTVAELSGSHNDLREWQDGKYDVIVVQIRSGGSGVDLTRASMAIYYSLSYSLGDYDQSRARVHRPGQTKSTTYIHLVANDTIDKIVYRALSDRKDVVDSILERIRQHV